MKWRYVGSLLLTPLLLTTTARAQLDTPSEAVVPTTHSESVAFWTRAGLNRTIALSLDRVTLRAALDTIAERGRVRLLYARGVVPLDNVVSLTASSITVADALRAILATTGVGVTIAPSGQLVLRALAPGQEVLSTPASTFGWQQGTATITGSVRDSGTGAIIPQVTVHIDGTSLSVKSSADGQYKLTGVAAGEYRVTARRVGYLAKTRTITLADGDNKKLNFDLNPPATQLNEVVTTALGEQRRYQVGNVISTINVDSVAPLAPVTSVTDLLAARVPGLEVVQSDGLAGAGPAIRIRGQSSLILQSDPIIIVDGIRVDNTPGGNNQLNIGGPAPARINDLDFSEIESISVLKGPTATTEYGTDAANGVIVITTKRGHAGMPMWDVSATQSAVIIPKTFANYYWDWGIITDGTATDTYARYGWPCNLAAAGWDIVDGLSVPPVPSGGCVVDSVTAFNPLDHTATTEYGTGPSNKYDVSVGGGTEQVTYYLAGGMQNDEGLLHVPDVLRSQAVALGFPNSALDPNSQNQERLAANGTIQLSPRVQIIVSGGYTSTYAETPGEVGYINPQILGPVLDDSASLFGYGTAGVGINSFYNPLEQLGNMTSQETEGWRGASTVDWRPMPGVAAHLTTGIVHEAQTDGSQLFAQSALFNNSFSDSSGGYIAQDQIRNDIYTIDFAANATWGVARSLRLTTTVGAQYVQHTSQGITAQASHLPASAFSLNDGTSGHDEISQSASSASTEGVYAEEEVGLGDRCFMPLALRIDAGNAFGTNVGSQNYPKWGLSCLVLTGATTLRLRGAFGAAGVQPPQGSAQSEFTTQSVQFPNQSVTASYQFFNPGNPNLRPEDDQEWEGGAELNVWGSRLSVSVTTYSKYAHNALYTVGLGALLQGGYTENVGDVRNMGQELELTVVPVEQRGLTASLTVSGSVNHNKLLRLAPNILSTEVGYGQYFVSGYPMFGYFGDTVRYMLPPGRQDGILKQQDIYVGNSEPSATPTMYMGSSLPIKQTAVQPSIALFRQRLVQVNAVFQYEGGFKVDMGEFQNYDGEWSSRASSVLGAPLWLQAYSLMISVPNGSEYGPVANQFLSGDNLSWNELSIAIGAPEAWRRSLRLRNVHAVLGVQNLALWTTYPFGDPRVSNGAGSSGLNGATYSSTANNDLRSTSATVTPLPRTWTVRINVGL